MKRSPFFPIKDVSKSSLQNKIEPLIRIKHSSFFTYSKSVKAAFGSANVGVELVEVEDELDVVGSDAATISRIYWEA